MRREIETLASERRDHVRLALDYGFMLNPPEFEIPQQAGFPPAIHRVQRGRFSFRFGQTF